MPRLYTLEQAETWFDIDTKLQELINKLEEKCKNLIKDISTLEGKKKEFRLNRYSKHKEDILYYSELLEKRCKPIERIIYILKHLTYRGTVVNYTIIKNETDVLITYIDIDTEDKWK